MKESYYLQDLYVGTILGNESVYAFDKINKGPGYFDLMNQAIVYRKDYLVIQS
jgi:hypothetical protein